MHKLDKNFFFSILSLSSSVIVGGILGYIFQIFSGRLLGIQYYGIFIALLSSSAIISASLKFFFLYNTNINSKFFSTNAYNKIFYFYKKNIYIFFSFIFFFIFIVFYNSDLLLKFFKISEIEILVLTFIYLVSTLFYSFQNSYLQSFLNFKTISINIIFENALRVAFLILFNLNGLNLSEVIYSIILPSIFVNISAFIITKKNIFKKIQNKQNKFLNSNFDLKYLFRLLCSNLILALLINGDTILVNYIFNTEEASLYAACAVIGKAVIYISSAVTIYLFPVASGSRAYNQNKRKKNFFSSVLFITVINLIFIVFSYYFGVKFIKLIYDESYEFSGYLLKYYAIAAFPISLIFLIENYFLAMKKILFTIILTFILPIVVIFVHSIHLDLKTIIYILSLIGYGTLLLGFVINEFQKKIL